MPLTSDQKNLLFTRAKTVALKEKVISLGSIQRKLRVGYNDSVWVFEELELRGIVGRKDKSGEKHVLIDEVLALGK